MARGFGDIVHSGRLARGLSFPFSRETDPARRRRCARRPDRAEKSGCGATKGGSHPPSANATGWFVRSRRPSRARHLAADLRHAPARQRHLGPVRQLRGQGLNGEEDARGGKSAGRPVRERSSRAPGRSRRKRLRHLLTICRGVSRRAAMASLSSPSAAYSTILARMTSRYGDVYFRAVASSQARSASDSSIRYGHFLGIHPLLGPISMPPSREICQSDTQSYLWI